MVPRGSGAQCDISTQIAGKAHAMNPLPGPFSHPLSPGLFFWENRKLPISFHCVKWELPSLEIDLRMFVQCACCVSVYS